MTMGVTTKIGVDGNSIGFYLKLHTMREFIGRDAEDLSLIRLGEKGLTVVGRGDTHGELGEVQITLSYIENS